MSDVDSFEAFSGAITDNFHNKLITVEFFCGKCCKKAIKGVLAHVDKHVIILTEPEEEHIKVVTFGEEGPIDTEYVEKIIIPVKNICSVEIPFVDDNCDS